MSTLSQQQRQDLVLTLQREIDCSQKLLKSLEQESSALAQRNVASLEQVVKHKQEIIQQLEQFGQQREQLLSAVDGDPLTEDSELASYWQPLLTLAQACQQKNRINGSIIELGYRQSQQALAVLKGKPSQAELYDDSGQTTHSDNTHPLAQV